MSDLNLFDPVVIQASGEDGMPDLDGVVAYLEKGKKIGVRLTGSSVGMGDHSGSVNGVDYFNCPLNSGVFVTRQQIKVRQLSRIEALKLKRELAAGQLDISRTTTTTPARTTTSDLHPSKIPKIPNHQAIKPSAPPPSIALNGLSPTALSRMQQLNQKYMTETIGPSTSSQEEEDLLVSDDEKSQEAESEEEEYLKENRKHISRLQQRKEEIRKRKEVLAAKKTTSTLSAPTDEETADKENENIPVVPAPSPVVERVPWPDSSSSSQAAAEPEPEKPLSRLEQLKLKKRQLETKPAETVSKSVEETPAPQLSHWENLRLKTRQLETEISKSGLETKQVGEMPAPQLTSQWETLDWEKVKEAAKPRPEDEGIAEKPSTSSRPSNARQATPQKNDRAPNPAYVRESTPQHNQHSSDVRQAPTEQHQSAPTPAIEVSLDGDASSSKDVTPVTQNGTHEPQRKQQTTKAIRVRIVNQNSNRLKDLIVEISAEITVFDAIYNHSGTKEANVRKWGDSVVQKVKHGAAEIIMEVTGTEYSVDQLKTLSTKELFKKHGEEHAALMVLLKCKPKPSAGQQESTNQGKEKPLAAASPEKQIRLVVKNKVSRRSVDMVVELSEEATLYDAFYMSPEVKESNIRRWGNSVVEEVKEGKIEIAVGVSTLMGDAIPDEEHFHFSVEELKLTTTQELVELYCPDYDFTNANCKIQLLLQMRPIEKKETSSTSKQPKQELAPAVEPLKSPQRSQESKAESKAQSQSIPPPPPLPPPPKSTAVSQPSPTSKSPKSPQKPQEVSHKQSDKVEIAKEMNEKDEGNSKDSSRNPESPLEKNPSTKQYAEAASMALPIHDTKTTFSDLRTPPKSQRPPLQESVEVSLDKAEQGIVSIQHQPPPTTSTREAQCQTTEFRTKPTPSPPPRQQDQEDELCPSLQKINALYWVALMFILLAALIVALFLGPVPIEQDGD